MEQETLNAYRPECHFCAWYWLIVLKKFLSMKLVMFVGSSISLAVFSAS